MSEQQARQRQAAACDLAGLGTQLHWFESVRGHAFEARGETKYRQFIEQSTDGLQKATKSISASLRCAAALGYASVPWLFYPAHNAPQTGLLRQAQRAAGSPSALNGRAHRVAQAPGYSPPNRLRPFGSYNCASNPIANVSRAFGARSMALQAQKPKNV